jgi:hypothetical protein
VFHPPWNGAVSDWAQHRWYGGGIGHTLNAAWQDDKRWMDQMLSEPYFVYAPAVLPNLQDEFRQMSVHEWCDGAWHEVSL